MDSSDCDYTPTFKKKKKKKIFFKANALKNTFPLPESMERKYHFERFFLK